MAQRKSPARLASPEERLARLIRDAHIATWVRDNPHHTAAEFAETKQLGRPGWLSLARELIRRGVLPPEEGEGE